MRNRTRKNPAPRRWFASEYDYLCTHEVQPSATQGGAVTPGNNAMGSWADVLTTPLTGDYHAVEVVAHGLGGTNTYNCEALLDFGWDPAGGTNYGATAETLAPFLNIAYAGPQNLQGAGLRFFLPVLIPGGSTLGARASNFNATVGTVYVYAKLYKARRPRDAVFGTQVVSFGSDISNSRGTSMTFGASGADGSWTLIASSLAEPVPWYWLVAAAGRRNNGLVAEALRMDLGFGSSTGNAREVLSEYFFQSTLESNGGTIWGGYARPGVGENLYARGTIAGASGGDRQACVTAVLG